MLHKYDILQKFEQAEAKCAEQTKRQFQNESTRFERSFNVLCHAFSVILRANPSQDSRKRAIILLVLKLIFAFKSIHDLTLKGYYSDARILERAVIEGLGLCALFSRDKDKASKWLKRKGLEMSKRQISHELAVFFRSAYDNRVKKLYSSLGQDVHSDYRAVLSFVPYKTDGSIGLKLLPFFEKEKATDFSIYPLLLSSILWVVFEKELGKTLRKEMSDYFGEMAEEMRN